MSNTKKNVVGFKRFSDIKDGKFKSDDIDLDDFNGIDDAVEIKKVVKAPMDHNLPKESSKIEEPISDRSVKPKVDNSNIEKNNIKNEKIETIGKVAKFPKNIKASNAYNFLENVKVSKKSIWYIMVEKQDNELQMVKYNYNEGVDLSQFVNNLKSYYLKKYTKNEKISKLIERIEVGGNDKYSMVKNIPLIEVDGKKMITKITEDLINLLSR